MTNKIYVANFCGNDPNCGSSGTVTVIDANNNYTTSTVNVGVGPSRGSKPDDQLHIRGEWLVLHLSVVPQRWDGTAINGANINLMTYVNVGVDPFLLAVDPVTNRIYVSNDCGTILLAAVRER